MRGRFDGRGSLWRYYKNMVTITFPDRETEKRALAFLLGRFSGRVLKSGEHLVPEAALEVLADQGIPFTVKGKATYEQQVAAIRGAAPSSVQ
jgi:hypothetical protein